MLSNTLTFFGSSFAILRKYQMRFKCQNELDTTIPPNKPAQIVIEIAQIWSLNLGGRGLFFTHSLTHCPIFVFHLFLHYSLEQTQTKKKFVFWASKTEQFHLICSYKIVHAKQCQNIDRKQTKRRFEIGCRFLFRFCVVRCFRTVVTLNEHYSLLPSTCFCV